MAATSKKQSSRKPERGSSVKEKCKGSQLLPAIILLIVAIAIIATIYELYASYAQVSFSIFKANFDSSSRIAIAVTYQNSSDIPLLISCSDALVQVIAHSRNASTIDFFMLNKTTCYYSPTGFGHAINISTESSSSCLKVADSEPSVFLNVSSSNSTTILPYHFYQNADSSYLAKCAIATEFG